MADHHYYAKAVAWAEAQGIVRGMTATTFAPEGKVTREQAVTFLYRYVTEYLKQEATEGADLKDYLDGHKVMDYAQTAFGWAVAEGALRGLWGWHAPSRHHPDPGSDGQASNHPGSEFLSFV